MNSMTFFDDPVIDKLLGIVMALAAENYVLKDRVRVMEALLVAKGLLTSEQIESFVPSSEQEERFRKEREEYFDRLLLPLTEGKAARPHS